MLAASSEPFDSDDYLFEIKWNGVRALASFGGGSSRLLGRKRTESSSRYPEIVAGLRALPGSGLLDGEIVVPGDGGRPDFQRVLVRQQARSPDAALLRARRHPAVYVAFDLLERDGASLLERPLLERKRRLSELLASPPPSLVESAYVIGRGRDLFREAEERGLEGLVAKRLDSLYLPGSRGRDWLALKVRREVEAIVVGLVRQRGGRRVKSLVLGGFRGGRLVWLGNVGSGIDGATLRELETELQGLRASPPEGFSAEAPGTIDWLRPCLVVRVAYSELTGERRLRHPVFLGFLDRRPQDCLAPEP